MPQATTVLFIVLLGLCLASSAHAFGAGEIPAYSELSKTAYRHGTIEQVLETLAKVGHAGGPQAGALLKGIAGALLGGGANNIGEALKGGGGAKFSGLDVKRVYFGNWLRDYSQAMDIAGLSKLSGDSIGLLIMCLGFMAFGYATEEFEVTKEKLGVYLCTEHIDNPKGYGEGEDARKYDPRLRPPVQDRELEIDERNGMKCYIATDGEGYDTSTACIRRHLERSIELGRNGGEAERYEAYRELGTALHTLEDFLAHSNYLELALNKLGNRQVFCHVGDNVRIRAPNGQNVPPLVTGTFGSSDFMISVLGEVNDKLSSSTVDDLNSKFSNAKTQQDNGNDGTGLLKTLLSKMPSANKDEQDMDNKIQNVENIRKNAINIDPNQIASKEVQQIFLDVLRTRDGIFKTIEGTLETLGLDDLIEELSNALSVLVLTTLEPYVGPIIKTATEGITAGSAQILKGEDQTIVFNDDNASDPTHSVLSKDHFDLWLNEPAGLAAISVVKHTVPLIVEAWSDRNANVDQIINTILEALHHPYFARDDSAVQRDMLDQVRRWLGGLEQEKRSTVLQSLTKESVKEGKNKREDADSYGTLGHRCGGAGHSHGNAGGGPAISGGYTQGSLGGAGRQNHQTLATGNRISGNPIQQQYGTYGRNDGDDSETRQNASRLQQPGTIGATMAGMQDRFGHEEITHASGGRHEQSSDGRYGSSGRNNDDYSGRTATSNQYSSGRDDLDNSYRVTENSYGRTEQAVYGTSDNAYERPVQSTYGQAENRYGQADNTYGGNTGRDEQSSEGYGARRNQQESENRYASSQPTYGTSENRYGETQHRFGGGQTENRLSGGRNNDDAGSRRHGGYERNDEEKPSYGRHGGREENENRFGRNEPSENRYSGNNEYEGRSSHGRNDEETPQYGQRQSGRQHHGYGGEEEQESGYEGRRGGNRRNDDDDEPSSRFGQMNLGGEGRQNRDNDYGSSGQYGSSGYEQNDDGERRREYGRREDRYGESDSDSDDRQNSKHANKHKAHEEKHKKHKEDSEDSDDDSESGGDSAKQARKQREKEEKKYKHKRRDS